MVDDNLIKECSCGNTDSFEHITHNDINLLVCKKCKTPHQYLPGWNIEMVNDFYTKKYHREEQIKIGHQTYHDRYDHDFKIAKIRLKEYKHLLYQGIQGLDIGSSNSAFVHAAREEGYSFMGIDPGANIGDDSLTIRSTIQDYNFNNQKFNFITMHDSFEHMVEVRKILSKIENILEKGGHLVIDIPDYYVPEGRHHWRPIQHLWYWNADQMANFLNEFKLKIIKITNPIPGKLVFYAEK